MTPFEQIKLGTDEVIGEIELKKALTQSKKIIVKFGIDPTTANVHMGHAVCLRKLRQFQDLGHRTMLLIGDFTASIGDPSGANKSRPVLTEEEISHNAETFLSQANLVLDMSKTELVFNSHWLKNMNLSQFVNYAKLVSVNNLIEREDFKNRLQANLSLGLHEFMYSVLQGIDSVYLKADLEIGGADQRLNMLMGRELQKKLGQTPQVVVTMPLLIGTDGEVKMSKSKGNYIGIDEPSSSMFGKLMRIPDKLINHYASSQGIDMSPASDNPRDRKAFMAEKIVELYHGSSEAEKAMDGFDKTFRQKIVAEELIAPLRIGERDLPLIQIVAQASGSSSSESRRLVEQGAVRVDGNVVNDPKHKVHIGNQKIRLQIGKRRFFELEYINEGKHEGI